MEKAILPHARFEHVKYMSRVERVNPRGTKMHATHIEFQEGTLEGRFPPWNSSQSDAYIGVARDHCPSRDRQCD
jgi:hypothetical protein